MPPYVHRPLSEPRSIRVIHLEEADKETAPLQCKLVEVSLDSQPVYKALSYSWDAQTPSHPIGCGSDILYITANCVAALQKIRKTETTPILWIDSICIDQTSNEERDKQVAMMADIYKQASDVIVWLGEADEASRKALQCIEDIALMTFEEARRTRALRLVMSIDIKKESDDPIGPLFKRSWFSRMWTIQEATLPPEDKVWILCGEVKLPWWHLTIAVGILEASQYRWGTWRSAMQLQTHLSGLPRKMKELESSSSAERLSLAQILNYGRGKAATNPRDKVFALFGILQELNIACPYPAYGKPLGRIYAEAMIACIQNGESLKVLYYVPSDNRHAELPSWAVDWSDRSWEKDDSRAFVTQKPFCASASSIPSWCFREETLHLVLRGKIVDSVKYLGQPLRVNIRNFSSITPDLIWGSFRMEPRSQWSLQETTQDMHFAFKILWSWVNLALSVGKSSGSGWVTFTKSIRAVTLLGKGFGEVIRPLDDVDKVCHHWKYAPKGRDYLAATTSTLKYICRKHGDMKARPLKLAKNVLRRKPGIMFEQCDCSQGRKSTPCERIQELYQQSIGQKSYADPFADLSGGVLFGRIKKLSLPWQTGRSTSSDFAAEELTSFHDSDIASSISSKSNTNKDETKGATNDDKGSRNLKQPLDWTTDKLSSWTPLKKMKVDNFNAKVDDTLPELPPSLPSLGFEDSAMKWSETLDE